MALNRTGFLEKVSLRISDLVVARADGDSDNYLKRSGFLATVPLIPLFIATLNLAVFAPESSAGSLSLDPATPQQVVATAPLSISESGSVSGVVPVEQVTIEANASDSTYGAIVIENASHSLVEVSAPGSGSLVGATLVGNSAHQVILSDTPPAISLPGSVSILIFVEQVVVDAAPGVSSGGNIAIGHALALALPVNAPDAKALRGVSLSMPSRKVLR